MKTGIPRTRQLMCAISTAAMLAGSLGAVAQQGQSRNYPQVGPHSTVKQGTGPEAPARASGTGSGTATSDPCRGLRGDAHARCMRQHDATESAGKTGNGQKPATEGHPPTRQ